MLLRESLAEMNHYRRIKGLAFQLSTLLLVLAGPVPLRPVTSTNSVFRPDAGTDAGELPPVTPFSDR